jgi:hypothetical protein
MSSSSGSSGSGSVQNGACKGFWPSIGMNSFGPTVLAAAIAAALSGIPLPGAAQGVTGDPDKVPLPPTPRSVQRILVAQPFTLQTAFINDWSKERREYTSGTLVVLEMDGAYLVPRNATAGRPLRASLCFLANTFCTPGSPESVLDVRGAQAPARPMTMNSSSIRLVVARVGAKIKRDQFGEVQIGRMLLAEVFMRKRPHLGAPDVAR